MKRLVKLYIASPLAADYQRRKESSPLSAQVLRGFPNGGNQEVSFTGVNLMLVDALRQSTTLAAHHSTGTRLAYEGLVLQIERRFKEMQKQKESEEASGRDLSRLFSIWAGEPRE